MSSATSNERTNTEREKANLLSLIKLTLNALIDQSSSTVDLPPLDDRNPDVTNFILTLERILCFRMKANWLYDRRFFWDFIRPACLSSCQQNIVERVEEVSKTRSLKEKGRSWIKFALMEKRLSDLLKIVLSDTQLLRKYYNDDSIITSAQAFILCDQLAGLSAIDFTFCFKHEGIILSPILLNDSEIDVIDLTPFLSYKSKQIKQILLDQINDEENKQPETSLEPINESKRMNSPKDTISLEKHKLEVEQRKYFEELLQNRDRELQQLKIRFDTMKYEHEREIIQMENIILELQTELRKAREEVETKRKKVPSPSGNISPKTNFNDEKVDSPTTPTNDQSLDKSLSFRSLQSNESNLAEMTNEKPLTDFVYATSESSRRSSHSTTTTNTEDDQYDAARKVLSNNDLQIGLNKNENKLISSPELLSSTTSLSSASSFFDENQQENEEMTIITASDTI